jgi:M6 family metalloprotease-like protein
MDTKGNISYAPAPASVNLVERNLLLVYVSFADNSGISELTGSELTAPELYDLVFNENKERSVAHYYKTVSGGGVKFIPAEETHGAENDGIIHVTLPGPHKDWGRGNYNSVREDVIGPALEAAGPYIDVSKYASSSLSAENLSIMVIVHGYESSAGLSPGVWGHAARGYDITQLDGVSIGSYCAFGAFQNKEPRRPFTIGIVVHELGHHSFGFKDLYDTGDYTYGIADDWSVMGSGSWGSLTGEPGGATPAGLDAYHLSTILPPHGDAKRSRSCGILLDQSSPVHQAGDCSLGAIFSAASPRQCRIRTDGVFFQSRYVQRADDLPY